jgi:ferredoxin-NADP reductase
METSERMNFNVIDKKTINLKTVYISISDVFFSKKNVTKLLGHHYAIWASDYFFTGPKNFLQALKHAVLAVDDRHVAFCEYNGSVARIICVAVATLGRLAKFKTISGMGPG